jgi:hypothetical protein
MKKQKMLELKRKQMQPYAPHREKEFKEFERQY